MTTVALCPACSAAVDLDRASVRCPSCGGKLPQRLRKAATEAKVGRRPVLITVMMVLFFVIPPMWFVMLGLALLTPGTTYSIGAQSVSREQFFLQPA
jgi:DNA-directed RNA polymerase subunit RPC12/RpoP